MRGWLAAAVAAFVAISLGLGAGCKNGPGAPGAESSAPGKQAAKSRAENQKQADKEKKAGATYDEVAKRLQGTSDAEKLGGLQDLPEVQSPDDRARLKDLVKKLTDDPSPAVQAGAVGAWAVWAREDASPLLKAAQSPDTGVRLAAARAMGGARPEDVRDALTKLKSDPDSTVAADAAATLAGLLTKTKRDEALDALIADLGNPQGDRSAQAGMKLEQAGRVDRRVIDRLMHALEASQNPAQRMSCVVVIGLASAGKSEGQKKFSALSHAYYRTASTPVPAYTVPVPLLMKTLGQDLDASVREAAAEALGILGDPRASVALGQALKDPDAYVRRRAASALIVVPPDPAKDQLIETAMKDPSPDVRRFAVEAMAGLPGNEGAGAVARCLADRDPDVRRYAAEVLGRIGTSAQTEALLPLFKDPDDDVRWKAVEAVSNFGDKRAKADLVEELWDPSARVALAAERGLHSLGIGKRVLTGAERTPARPATR